jgi:protein SCO1/2
MLLGIFAAERAGADDLPPALEAVGITEKIGNFVPGDSSFTDSAGAQIRLQQFLNKDKPVLLNLVYYQCPMLCNLVLTGLVKGLKASGLRLGEDYLALTVSIDPKETPDLAAERKRGHLQALGISGADPNWAFTTGNEQQIHRLAESVGFEYAYDESTKQYAHAAATFVLTPAGKISRYLYGFEYSPRDLKLALVEASGGRVGTSFDRFLLTCFRYEPALRRYGFYMSGILRGGALLVFAGLCALLVNLWRRELKRGTA